MNFETFTRNPEPYGELTAAAGSFNTHKASLSVGTGMLNERFTLDMRLSKIYSDGYIDRAFSDLKSFALSGAYYGEKSLVKINLISGVEKTYLAWEGVPSVRLSNDTEGMSLYEQHWLYTPEETAHMIRSGSRTYNRFTYENETDNYQQDHYQLFFSRELMPQLVLNTGFHYTYGRGYYEQYKNEDDLADYGLEDIITGGDTIGSTDLVRQKWLDNDFFGLVWSLDYRYSKLEAHLGGGWNNYDGRHFGNVIWARNAGDTEINHEWYRNVGVKVDWNTFLKVNYKAASKLNLYADLQYRTIVHEMEGIDDDLRDIGQEHEYRFWNPKAGATFELSNRQRLAVSVATGHREPNRSNFVDADPAHPLPTYETLIDYELSYRLNSTRTTLEANLYYMDYHNQLILTGEINDVGNPVMKNMKDSYRTGIELITGIIFVETLRWDLNLTLSRNRIRNFTDYVDDWDIGSDRSVAVLDETEISFSPAVIGGSKITFEPVEGLRASLLSKYVGKQYIDNSSTEEYTLDPYFVNDLQIVYTIKTDFIREVSLNLLLNNILNTEYESNAWIYKYYYGGTEYKMDGYFPQAGFHFLAGVTLGF
jgi:iron complex outermembrane receptor protein